MIATTTSSSTSVMPRGAAGPGGCRARRFGGGPAGGRPARNVITPAPAAAGGTRAAARLAIATRPSVAGSGTADTVQV